MFKCTICDAEFKTLYGLGNHIKRIHKIEREEYYKKFIGNSESCICGAITKFLDISKGYKKLCKKCAYTLNGFIYKTGSEKAGLIEYTKYKKELTQALSEARSLKGYIKRYGEIKGHELYKLHNKDRIITEKKMIQKYGEEKGKEQWQNICNKKKFSNSKIGYIQKYGEEKAYKILKSLSEVSKLVDIYGEKDGKNLFSEKQKRKSKRCITYWINKGYSEEEAKKQVQKHQSTFSLEKCIEKYGNEKGLNVWESRQIKWQTTLRAKSAEEIKNINKRKYPGEKSKYSVSIAEKELKHILKCNSQLELKGFWYDLYYENKIIEYNGDYWHCNPIKFSKDYINPSTGLSAKQQWERDKIKNDIAICEGFDILIIWEYDYKKDKKGVIKKCQDFLYGKN